MKVIIAGGRDFNDYALLKEKCDFYLQNQSDIVIISGGAKGADTLAIRYAKEHGYECILMPANWDFYGKRAGYVRNSEMAATANALIAFWDGKSKGTSHMINLSKELGLITRVVSYNTDEFVLFFSGEFSYLSNFYPCKVMFEGRSYACAEGAYQAAKTTNLSLRIPFETMNGGEAKKAGRKLTIRSDWENIKLFVMTTIVRSKFSSNKDLGIKLKQTISEVTALVEGNYWHDNFWGNCTCPKCVNIVGQNILGKILMMVREEL